MRLFGILLIICFSFEINAATFYVDYTLGDDSNSGTSESSPWKTLLKLENFNFQPGDSILLKRGEVWPQRLYIESSGTENDPIYIGPYGSGDKPRINVMQDYNLSWTYDSNNIWYNTQLSDNPKRLLKDGVEILDAASDYFDELGTNIPDLVEWYWGKKDSNDSQEKLYLYSISDPNNSTFTLSQKAYAVEFFDIHYVEIHDLEIIGANLAAITLYSCSHITLVNLDVGKYANYGIEMTCYKPNGTDWQIGEYNVIDNCTVNTYYTFDYSGAGTQSGKSNRGPREGILIRRNTRNCEIKNCLIKNYCHANINIWAPIENEQPVEEQEVKDNKIHHNLITSPDLAYGGRIAIDGYCHHNEIYDNKIEYTSVQTQLNGHDNHIHHNIFKNTINSPLKDWKVGHAISLQGYYSKVYGNIIENNLMIDCEAAGFFLSGNNSVGDVTDNYIRNNIIYNCGTDYSDYGISLETDFNTYSNDGNHFLNNLIYNSGTTQTIRFYGNTYDVQSFNNHNGSHGHEIVNNIGSDPDFIDIANEDYHINESSPCIDSGVLPLATKDYDNNDIPHGPNADIGLYENQYILPLNGFENFFIKKTNNIININWKYNSDFVRGYELFHINKSLDYNNWYDIGEIAINKDITEYSFNDKEDIPGWIYYRICATGKNVNDIYTNILSVYIIRENDPVIIFPNPGKNIYYIKLNSSFLDSPVTFSVFNMKKILVYKIIIDKPDNDIFTIDLNRLGKGVYIMKIQTPNISLNKKILKQ